MACSGPQDRDIGGKPGAQAAACADRDRGQPVQGRQGVHTSYIEEPVSCSVKHGKRGEIPRDPTTSHSQTGLRQRPLELLPEGLSWHIRDVGHPELVRSLGREVTLHQIRRRPGILVALRRPPLPSSRHTHQTPTPHQP